MSELHQINKIPSPLHSFLKVGQAISYCAKVSVKPKEKDQTKNRQKACWHTFTGEIIFVSPYIACIRDKKGIVSTFTAVDVFTDDIRIDGMAKKRNILADILGLLPNNDD